MRKIKPRVRVNAETLTGHSPQKIALSIFSKCHGYASVDAGELLSELEYFGITANESFRLLMKKHRRAILLEEKQNMLRAETLDLLRQFNPAGIDVYSNTSRFAVSSLVREALEKGGSYRTRSCGRTRWSSLTMAGRHLRYGRLLVPACPAGNVGAVNDPAIASAAVLRSTLRPLGFL